MANVLAIVLAMMALVVSMTIAARLTDWRHHGHS